MGPEAMLLPSRAAETLEKFRAFKRVLYGQSRAAFRVFDAATVRLLDPETLEVTLEPQWRDEATRPEVAAWLARCARQVHARLLLTAADVAFAERPLLREDD